jgi:putative spermidine/putrescine transport system permease protein
MEASRRNGGKEIISSKLQMTSQKKYRQLKKRYLPAMLLLLPLLLLIVGFFLVPMLNILYLSFMQTDGLDTANAKLTIANYVDFFSDPYYLQSLWLTIKISLYTVIVSLVLSYPVAMTMANSSPRARGYLALLVASPLLISVVVRNFGFTLLLMPNGTIHQFFQGLGIDSSSVKLLFSETGVVIGLSNAYLPFMILAIATSLYNIDPAYSKASAILGASPLRTFISITLPLSLPGVVSGVVLVFSLSMSAYVTPALMGGAKIAMLPMVAYDQIIHMLRWTYGSAISYVLLGVTLILVMVFTRSMERSFKEVFR